MSLLFPAMLAGLVGLGIPFALHLIAKHKFPVRDFPTLRLLMRDERTNVFAPRLIDPWQLLLRLLVLTLLVLAMARVFLPGFSSTPAPRNLVVVVDCSASMNLAVKNPTGSGQLTLLELARRKARELLGEISAPSQCALIAAADDTHLLAELQPSPAAALAALSPQPPDARPHPLSATDGSGRGLLHAIAAAGDLVRGRREVKSQIVVLTDLRATAFATRNQRDLLRLARARADLGDRLDLILVDLATGATENLAITEARVRGSRVKVGDDAHILARLRNSGTNDRTAKIQLAIGNQPDPAIKEIPLAAGAEAVVDLTTPVNRSVRAIAQARLKEPDALPADDTFSVPLNVAETRRVLIINGASQAAVTDSALARLGQPGATAQPKAVDVEETVDGATILRFVLNPGRELGRASGTGIDTTLVTPEALAGQTLSKFELVVLYDVTSLPAQAVEDLNTFVRQGRSLLFVGAGGVNALQFNRLFFSADPQRPGLAPAQLGNDKDFAPALALADTSSPHPWLAPFRDRLQGDLSGVRFTKARELPAVAAGATAMLTGADGRPLAVEMPLEKGRVAMLAFGFELDRGNLARTRVFPALMWRLVDYLTGQLRVRPPDILTALQPAVLDVSEPAFAFATELELTTLGDATNRPPVRLKVNADQTVLVPALPAGDFALHKPRAIGAVAGHTRHITVHTDAQESDFTRATEPQLRDWLGGEVRVTEAAEAVKLAPPGSEFWRPLLLLLLIAYLAEALTSYVMSARREKQRVAEASA
jgi:hypothetical protein